MSVKMMTTDQIHNDLASIHNMWAGGIPPEQTDRVNALHAELKRRGAEARPASQDVSTDRSVGRPTIDTMTAEQLQAELKRLSNVIGTNPNDDAVQEQFANVRFELRKRAKNGTDHMVSETPKVAAYDPVTGETDLQRAVRGEIDMQAASGNGHIEALKTEFIVQQERRLHEVAEQARKMHTAQLAVIVAATLLTKHADPNGDDVENACSTAVQVAMSVLTKVGL